MLFGNKDKKEPSELYNVKGDRCPTCERKDSDNARWNLGGIGYKCKGCGTLYYRKIVE